MLEKIARGLELLAAFEGVTLHAVSTHYLIVMKDKRVIGGAKLKVQRFSSDGYYEKLQNLGIKANDQWHMVTEVVASSPRIGYLIFIACLTHFKQLVPDYILSNASKQIILRWHQRYKETKYVVPDLLEESARGDDPFVAGYLCPPDVKSPLPVKEEPLSDEWMDRGEDMSDLFLKAYGDQRRKRNDVKTTLDLILKTRDFPELLPYLTEEVSTKTRIQVLRWLIPNLKNVQKVLNQKQMEAVLENFPELSSHHPERAD